MLRLTLKNLVANRVRFALTTFGVVLAVAFVVSAFVLGDGLRSTFGDLSEEIGAGTDLEVEYDGSFGEGEFFPAGTRAVISLGFAFVLTWHWTAPAQPLVRCTRWS